MHQAPRPSARCTEIGELSWKAPTRLRELELTPLAVLLQLHPEPRRDGPPDELPTDPRQLDKPFQGQRTSYWRRIRKLSSANIDC